jgi:hypothetical protein
MIGQYLPNNNETATVAFRQKICQLNSLCDGEPNCICQATHAAFEIVCKGSSAALVCGSFFSS